MGPHRDVIDSIRPIDGELKQPLGVFGQNPMYRVLSLGPAVLTSIRIAPTWRQMTLKLTIESAPLTVTSRLAAQSSPPERGLFEATRQ